MRNSFFQNLKYIITFCVVVLFSKYNLMKKNSFIVRILIILHNLLFHDSQRNNLYTLLCIATLKRNLTAIFLFKITITLHRL